MEMHMENNDNVEISENADENENENTETETTYIDENGNDVAGTENIKFSGKRRVNWSNVED